jgi:hypothetical protein
MLFENQCFTFEARPISFQNADLAFQSLEPLR